MKYMANDGKVFDSMKVCSDYEKYLLNKSYWEVVRNYTEHSEDGIVSTFKIVMAIPSMENDNYTRLFIQDWCTKFFGSPLLFTDINGVPIRKYSIHKISKAEYEKGKVTPFDKNDKASGQTKLFATGEMEDGALQIGITGFYGIIEMKYKDIKDINQHEKRDMDNLFYPIRYRFIR